jgi:hypothetical protein
MDDGGSDSSVEYRKGLFTAEMQKLNLSYSEPTVNWRFFSHFVYYLLLYLSAAISNNRTTACMHPEVLLNSFLSYCHVLL